MCIDFENEEGHMNNKITRYKVSYHGLDADKWIENCDFPVRMQYATNSGFVNVADLSRSSQNILSKLKHKKHNTFVNIGKIDY